MQPSSGHAHVRRCSDDGSREARDPVVASFVRGATTIPVPVFETDAVLDLIERESVTMLPGPPTSRRGATVEQIATTSGKPCAGAEVSIVDDGDVLGRVSKAFVASPAPVPTEELIAWSRTAWRDSSSPYRTGVPS